MEPENKPFQWANDPNPLLVRPYNWPNIPSKSISIPIIDMNNKEEVLIKEIAKACEIYGAFMIINHGIPQELCQKVLDVVTQFFYLPHEIKAEIFSETPLTPGKINRSVIHYRKNNKPPILMWGESFCHPWHPVNTSIQKLTDILSDYYWETFLSYSEEIGQLMFRLLSIISRGLGQDKDCLRRWIEEEPDYPTQTNYYPPCPNPKLTLGLRIHSDKKVLTIVLPEQGVTGLHIKKDNKDWFAVDPVDGALVVFVADQLKELTQEKYKSVQHTVVPDFKKGRASFATFAGRKGVMLSKIPPIEELAKRDSNKTEAKLKHYSVYRKRVNMSISTMSYPKSSAYFSTNNKFTTVNHVFPAASLSLPSTHVFTKSFFPKAIALF